jgi:NaMN:DMB phosphoribosyltransferase
VSVDLDLTGFSVAEADADAGARARERLAEDGTDVAMGRLADLAVWWASVRGDDRAAPPDRVWTGLGRLPEETGDVAAALVWGIERADAVADAGTELMLLTVDCDEPARLASAELLGLDPVESSGWPLEQGMDDEEWMDAVIRLRDGWWRTRGLRGDLVRLLTALGSPMLAAATALVVQSGVRRTPVLLDGSGALAAALLARRTAHVANQWWQVAHADSRVLTDRTLTSLHLEPLLRLGITAQEGTGARLGLGLLTEAAGLLR